MFSPPFHCLLRIVWHIFLVDKIKNEVIFLSWKIFYFIWEEYECRISLFDENKKLWNVQTSCYKKNSPNHYGVFNNKIHTGYAFQIHANIDFFGIWLAKWNSTTLCYFIHFDFNKFIKIVNLWFDRKIYFLKIKGNF